MLSKEYTSFVFENKTKYKIYWFIKGVNIHYIQEPKLINKIEKEEIQKKSSEYLIGKSLKFVINPNEVGK
jgi:hypothetical protein